jgi:photosystem II stability/assembly factor-like uncharacterized protein
MVQHLLKHWRLWGVVFSLSLSLTLLGGFWLITSSSSSVQKTASLTYSCNNTQMTAAQVAVQRGISPATLQLLGTKLAYTPDYVCKLSEKELESALGRLGSVEADKDKEEGVAAGEQAVAAAGEEENDADAPKADEPDKALEWRKLRLKDDNGNIPPDGLLRAQQQARAMQRSPRAAGINTGAWTWLGPGNIGGRIRSLVINPTNPQIMVAGSVGGGLWRTTDGGANWTVVNDFLANLAVSTMVMDPANSNIIYAGTGEGFYNSDGIQGAGIFKSTDGGVNWTQLPNTNNSNYYYVNRLAISSSGRILAATRNGIFYSDNSGSTWNSTTGILADSVGVLDVNFDPFNANNAVAGGSYGRVYYSTNAGASWTAVSTGWTTTFSTRVEVAYAPNASGVVYASIGQNSGEIWRSINGGVSYTRVNTGNSYLGSQAWYDNALWVDPTDSNTVIVGGIDLYRGTYNAVAGTLSLTPISQWQNGPPIGSTSAHADHHFIIEKPGFNGAAGPNKTVYFTNDGGIFRTDNVYTVAQTSGWINLNNGIGITQFYGAAGNSASGKIVAGAQDNGHLQYSGTTTWKPNFGGDGGYAAYDPTDPNYSYGEYVYLKIHRNTNGGTTVNSSQYIYSNGLTDASTNSANFIAPFILDPNNNNTILAGGLSLWRSTNIKASPASSVSWTAIKSPGPNYISAIAVAQGNSNIIWVGDNSGNVYFTTNGTNASPTWTQVDNNTTALPNRMVTRITIDPTNSNIVYVTFGGFSNDTVWRSADSGTSWNKAVGTGVGTTLPQVPVYSLLVNPLNSTWLYVGTDIGIFTSQDSGATWTLPQDGPSNVSVDELAWLDNSHIIAATHGRGVYKATVTLTTNPVPTLTSISPNTVAVGSNTFAMAVNGTNFTNTSVVVWNGTNLATTYVDANRLVATVPAALVGAVGTPPVTVVNPAPGGGTTSPLTFTITNSCNPLIVTNTGTSGCGSLPAAALAAVNGSTIQFALPANTTINLNAPLVLAAGANINGLCTATGPGIIINGAAVAGPGLQLSGNSSISGLQIKGFANSGTNLGRNLDVNRNSNTPKNSFKCVKVGG